MVLKAGGEMVKKLEHWLNVTFDGVQVGEMNEPELIKYRGFLIDMAVKTGDSNYLSAYHETSNLLEVLIYGNN